MKNQHHIRIAADVVRALKRDPHTSNSDLAQQYGVSVGFVRRYRSVMELADVLETTDTRTGVDGVTRSIPACV